MKMFLRITIALACCAAGALFACPGDPPQPDRPPRTNEQREVRRDADQARSKDENRKREFQKLSPAEKEAKRKEIKARLDARLAELRSRETNGTLTAAEQRELSRCEQIRKRFDQPRQPRPDRKENAK